MEEQNLPTKIDELTAELANKDPLVLASISSVPYFGSSLATFFSAKWLKIYQQRTDALFQKFGEHLNDLDEQAIRRDYFDTPEGIDLLIKAVEQSSKTRSEEKRDLIARILCGGSIASEGSEYSPEEYLYLISDLTIRELRVARLMYRDRPHLEGESWEAWENEVCEELSLDNNDLHMLLDRLGSTGLLGLVTTRKEGDDLVFYGRDTGEGGHCVVTSSFHKLMKFLQLKI